MFRIYCTDDDMQKMGTCGHLEHKLIVVNRNEILCYHISLQSCLPNCVSRMTGKKIYICTLLQGECFNKNNTTIDTCQELGYSYVSTLKLERMLDNSGSKQKRNYSERSNHLDK